MPEAGMGEDEDSPGDEDAAWAAAEEEEFLQRAESNWQRVRERENKKFVDLLGPLCAAAEMSHDTHTRRECVTCEGGMKMRDLDRLKETGCGDRAASPSKSNASE